MLIEISIFPDALKKLWTFSFCETYPQYVKFFTLESRLPANFDARTTAKFSIIMETMGYLLLDFNNKPRRLDQFVGYIAMIHKDMRLDEQDMHVRITYCSYEQRVVSRHVWKKLNRSKKKD